MQLTAEETMAIYSRAGESTAEQGRAALEAAEQGWIEESYIQQSSRAGVGMSMRRVTSSRAGLCSIRARQQSRGGRRQKIVSSFPPRQRGRNQSKDCTR